MFESTIEIEKEEKKQIQIYNTIDYKLGQFLLQPLRFIKTLFK